MFTYTKITTGTLYSMRIQLSRDNFDGTSERELTWNDASSICTKRHFLDNPFDRILVIIYYYRALFFSLFLSLFSFTFLIMHRNGRFAANGFIFITRKYLLFIINSIRFGTTWRRAGSFFFERITRCKNRYWLLAAAGIHSTIFFFNFFIFLSFFAFFYFLADLQRYL